MKIPHNAHPVSPKELSDFVDGGLEKKESNRILKHLEACGECRKLEAEYRDLNQRVGRSFPEANESVWKNREERILARIRSAKLAPKVSSLRLFYPFVGTMALLTVLSLASLFWIQWEGGGSRDEAWTPDVSEYSEWADGGDAESLVESLSPGERKKYLKLLSAEFSPDRPEKIL